MFRNLFVCLLIVSLQTEAQAVRELQLVERLEMPPGLGENGGTVALNQRNKNYLATIAGNRSYALAVFNNLFELISPLDLAQLYDIRGLWYHPVQKTFYANAYGDTGWIKYTIDNLGIPYDAVVIFKGKRQPFPQSVGQFSHKENLVYFLKGSVAVAYDAKTGDPSPAHNKLLKIGYSRKKPPPSDWQIDSLRVLSEYNSTTLIYTGISNSEFGLLNVQNREIELYSAADGLMTTRLKIPNKIPVRNKLNFAFCNNYYWLYDTDTRSWLGLR